VVNEETDDTLSLTHSPVSVLVSASSTLSPVMALGRWVVIRGVTRLQALGRDQHMTLFIARPGLPKTVYRDSLHAGLISHYIHAVPAVEGAVRDGDGIFVRRPLERNGEQAARAQATSIAVEGQDGLGASRVAGAGKAREGKPVPAIL